MTYTLEDLLYLMRRLRNPETGCPWDLKQDFASVLPHTLEEAYEVADAIEREDWPHLEEELGDLLFQVIFYGQIAAERQVFNTERVIDKLVKKLVRRHPHVFPDGNLQSERTPGETQDEQAIKASWEAIKQDDQVAFDCADVVGVFDTVNEELLESKAELAIAADKARQHAELGALLFTLVNLARHLGIDPETDLRGCNTRFNQRFNLVEKQIEQQGGWENADIDSMEKAWQKTKESSTLK